MGKQKHDPSGKIRHGNLPMIRDEGDKNAK